MRPAGRDNGEAVREALIEGKRSHTLNFRATIGGTILRSGWREMILA